MKIWRWVIFPVVVVFLVALWGHNLRRQHIEQQLTLEALDSIQNAETFGDTADLTARESVQRLRRFEGSRNADRIVCLDRYLKFVDGQQMIQKSGSYELVRDNPPKANLRGDAETCLASAK
jgi:hypothetical protein